MSSFTEERKDAARNMWAQTRFPTWEKEDKDSTHLLMVPGVQSILTTEWPIDLHIIRAQQEPTEVNNKGLFPIHILVKF